MFFSWMVQQQTSKEEEIQTTVLPKQFLEQLENSPLLNQTEEPQAGPNVSTTNTEERQDEETREVVEVANEEVEDAKEDVEVAKEEVEVAKEEIKVEETQDKVDDTSAAKDATSDTISSPLSTTTTTTPEKPVENEPSGDGAPVNSNNSSPTTPSNGPSFWESLGSMFWGTPTTNEEKSPDPTNGENPDSTPTTTETAPDNNIETKPSTPTFAVDIDTFGQPEEEAVETSLIDRTRTADTEAEEETDEASGLGLKVRSPEQQAAVEKLMETMRTNSAARQLLHKMKKKLMELQEQEKLQQQHQAQALETAASMNGGVPSEQEQQEQLSPMQTLARVLTYNSSMHQESKDEGVSLEDVKQTMRTAARRAFDELQATDPVLMRRTMEDDDDWREAGIWTNPRLMDPNEKQSMEFAMGGGTSKGLYNNNNNNNNRDANASNLWLFLVEPNWCSNSNDDEDETYPQGSSKNKRRARPSNRDEQMEQLAALLLLGMDEEDEDNNNQSRPLACAPLLTCDNETACLDNTCDAGNNRSTASTDAKMEQLASLILLGIMDDDVRSKNAMAACAPLVSVPTNQCGCLEGMDYKKVTTDEHFERLAAMLHLGLVEDEQQYNPKKTTRAQLNQQHLVQQDGRRGSILAA
ncbi:hypothetical protein ACA910_012348 [Epithemia clementina (nom. ined.)]